MNEGSVIILGNGLNDSVTLKQSRYCSYRSIAFFSPGSDALLKASALMNLSKLISLAHYGTSVIIASIVL
jgi:hypothetical protein